MIDTLFKLHPITAAFLTLAFAIVGGLLMAPVTHVALKLRDKGVRQRWETTRAWAWDVVRDARNNPKPEHDFLARLRWAWLFWLRPRLRKYKILWVATAIYAGYKRFTALRPVQWVMRIAKWAQTGINNIMITFRVPYEFVKRIFQTIGKFFGWGNLKKVSLFMRKIWPMLIGLTRRLPFVVAGAWKIAFAITLILVIVAVMATPFVLLFFFRRHVVQRWIDFLKAITKHIAEDFINPLKGKYFIEWIAISTLTNLFSLNATAAWLGWIDKSLGMVFAAMIAGLAYFIGNQFRRAYKRRKAHKSSWRKLLVRWHYRAKRKKKLSRSKLKRKAKPNRLTAKKHSQRLPIKKVVKRMPKAA